ncbi:hypothetical protein [Aliterella atlantica]|uniref:NACHT C-terminal Cysteine and Histidine-containing domain-containing protein n=1 Tax=Aliterella atlantica CENA595 TaxID=1618023 RepID=A0A0D8ZT49_9CYAN|nr:hypothetical protein [Aliterella atlantica]KJH71938.1 hypothetical protein UH38_09445 [Aliterella atlantica CENA595]
MNDWHYFFNHVPHNLAASTYCVFEPQYKTEIFNWFRREDVAKEQKEDFIQALIDFSDDCGDFYCYRAYILAAEALNYYKDCSLGDAIASQILKWSYAFFRQDKQDWQTFPEPLVTAARVALEKTDRNRVVSAFVHLVHTTESKTILRIAAEKLGKLDPGNKSAIAALVLLLEATQDDSDLWHITRSLMQIDPDNPVVISTLANLIQANTDGWANSDCRWSIIRYATKAIREVSTGNLTAIKFLVQLIQTTADKYICWDAIKSLGEIATGNQTAIAALTEFLQINQGDCICFDAAKALWQIDEGNADAIAAFIHMIATNTDGFIFNQSASYLVQIAPKNVKAIAALTERLETTQDEYFRCRSAASLLQFEPDNKLALATLIDFVNFVKNLQVDSANNKVVGNLERLIAGDRDAIAVITQRITSAQDSYFLREAIYMLEESEIRNKNGFETLIDLIQTFDELARTSALAETWQSPRYSQLLKAANELQEILLREQMWQVIVALKDYLSASNQDSSYRYEACYKIIWHCAQNIPYLDFYKAWHSLP